jgi:hypothetical protein
MSLTLSGSNGVTFPDASSMKTGQQACKAWVNFNGTGTVAIRASYNVSSITDKGVGSFAVNFTEAMSDINYATSVSGSGRSSDDDVMAYAVSNTSTINYVLVSGPKMVGQVIQDAVVYCVTIYR